jgi:hypothetical protein
MSRKQFDDECQGCRPVILDRKTMEPFPDDSVPMQAVNAVWSTTTKDQREAFHRFTCLNSRDPGDVGVMQTLTRMFEQEIRDRS